MLETPIFSLPRTFLSSRSSPSSAQVILDYSLDLYWNDISWLYHFYRLLFSFFTFQFVVLKKYLNFLGGNLGKLVIPALTVSEHQEAGGGKKWNEREEGEETDLGVFLWGRGKGRQTGVLVPRLPVAVSLGKYSMASLHVQDE